MNIEEKVTLTYLVLFVLNQLLGFVEMEWCKEYRNLRYKGLLIISVSACLHGLYFIWR